MRLRIIASVLVRALPVVGPFLRRLDMHEVHLLMARAELDLLRAQVAGLMRPVLRGMSPRTCTAHGVDFSLRGGDLPAYTCAMTAHHLVSGEGPRARIVLDRIAAAAGLGSGQALLCHIEGLDAEGIAMIAEGVAATMPPSKPVDELAATAA